MSVTLSHVRDIFKSLGAGDGSEFLYPRCRQRRLDGEGTHPLAGHYQSKADFLTHTFEKLAQRLTAGHTASSATRVGKRRMDCGGNAFPCHGTKRPEV